jgi:hypothetical protein
MNLYLFDEDSIRLPSTVDGPYEVPYVLRRDAIAHTRKFVIQIPPFLWEIANSYI